MRPTDVGVVDPDGGAGLIYYAEYRLDPGLNAALELVLKDTATVAGFRATISGATATASSNINGKAGFVLSGGTIVEAVDSGTAAGSFAK